MNKLLKKLLVLGLASTVALASVGGIGCNKDDGPTVSGPTVPNTSTVEKPDPEITIASSISLLLGEEKSAGVTTKNVKGDVVYSVNNEGKNVVTFENGNVKAIGVGSAIITASYGSVSASCPVTVTYGNFLPSLEIASNITEGVYLALGSSNTIAPYINYNGLIFDDGQFTYSSDNEEVVSVSKSGVITANQATDEPVNVTVNATWRDFSSNDYATLSKTFSVEVRNNVAFLVNGEIPVDLSVNTPATFQVPAEHNNVIKVAPTVVVNGEEKSLSGSNVNVVGLGDTQKGRDFLWDANKQNFAAFKKGRALVELSYSVDGDLFTENFEIEITRPTKVLDTTVELFSSRSGLYKVDNGNGTYTDQALEMVAWGKDVTLIDAYSEGISLTVNNSNGAVYGLPVNQDGEINATITLGTATDLIEVPVKAAAYYMANAEDVRSAVEQIGLYEEIKGYHKLLCDVDMAGVFVDNRIDSSDDFGAVRYAGYRLDGAYIDSTSKKKIGFNGVFDGDGHTISNATVRLQNYRSAVYTKYPYGEGTGAEFIRYGNNRSYGFFHNVLADGVIKNVAFENFGGEYVDGDQNTLYGLVSPLSYAFSGTLQDVYVDVRENNPTSRGIVTSNGATSTFKNVLVEFHRDEDYDFATQVDKFCSNDLYAYGYGSFTNGTPSASATYNGVYVITKMPLAFSTDRPFNTSDTSNKNAISYAENETELIYNFAAFDLVHGAVKHTVKSTLGDHLEDGEGNVLVTGKTKVVKGIQRYNSYADLANCEYEKTAERSQLFASSKYWAVAGNVPIWHSMLDKHSDNYSATIGGENELTIDLYDSQPIDVTLYGASASNVKFTENSDLIEISANNVIKGVKIGTGAEVVAEFTYGGKQQTLTFTVDVLYPFYLTKDGETFEGSTFNPEGEEFNVSIMASGNLVENVRFTSDSPDALTINGSTFKGIKYKDGIVVTANFTYMGDSYTETFTLDILDMIAEDAILVVDGNEIEGEEFSLVIDANPSTISLKSDAGNIASVIVASSNANFIANGDKVMANLYGDAQISITFNLGGQVHVKKVTGKAVHSDVVTKVNSVVDFDAANGKLITSEIDDTGVVSATVVFGKDTMILTKENGGITEDGKIRAKASNGDLVPGIAVINNASSKFEDAKLTMTVATYKKVYELTAQYYTSIIENAQELKDALDIDYSMSSNNLGFYKLANNISIDPSAPLTYSYVGANTIGNINSNVGFVGLFDGCGYSIDFNGTDVGPYGIFGNFNHTAQLYLKDPTTVKNFAILEYNSKYYSNYWMNAPVLGRFAKNHNYSGFVQFSDIYLSYAATASPNGLVVDSGNFATYNNIVIDSSAITGKVTRVDSMFGDAEGMISPLAGYNGGVLFGQMRYVNSTLANELVNNVVAIGELPLVKGKKVYSLSSGLFTHTRDDDGNYTHTLKHTGYTFSQTNMPTLDGSTEFYYAIPGNKQDMAMIQGLRPEVEALATKNSGTTLKIKACLECFGTFLTGRGTKCTVESCGAALTTIDNIWTSPVAFDWTFDINEYVNPKNTEGNGIMVFKGAYKYDTVEEMKKSGNDFASFKAVSYWDVVDGQLVWVGANA